MKYPLRILLVEDNPTDRELLRYLLESRFAGQVKFFEAPTLAAAFALADHSQPSCVILDLQLPDSTGKTTFTRLFERLPRTVPIIVMTHNKDRQLALETIQAGAADYVIKNFTDEELFQRIVFAIEKHERTIPVQPEDAVAFNRLEKVKASVAKAKRTNSVPNMYAANMDAAEAVAEVSQRMISELSKLSAQVMELARESTERGVEQKRLVTTVDALEKELLRGHSARPSMRSQLDILDHRVGGFEMSLQSVRNAVVSVESSQHKAEIEVKTTYITARTKILLGVLALVGAIAGAVATYEASKHRFAEPVKVETKR